MPVKRIALIPAYEPDNELVKIVYKLWASYIDVVVVDDGSGGGSQEVFLEAEKMAAIIRHEVNKGKGAAIKTGLDYIESHYPQPYSVVTVDADGQHKLHDILRVLEALEEDSGALVLGSRRFTGKVPLRSRFGNLATRFVFRMASGAGVYDTQTGLRAFSHSLVPRLMKIPGNRYEYEMNVLMLLTKEGVRIREVPIETVYLEGNASSHFDTLRDSWRIYREIIKFSAASLAGFLADYSLYCILYAATGLLEFSNIAARIASASLNYTLNRKLVFKSSAPAARSAAQYAALAAAILLGNTFLLRALAYTGMNRYVAKIVTELIFFVFSWVVQRKVVFKNEEKRYEKA